MGSLKCENIKKVYGKKEVLKDVNLELESGKIYGLIGRNGVGKTTLLSILSSQNPAGSGRVTLDGEDVWENEKCIDRICFSREISQMSGFGQNNLKIKDYMTAASIFYPNWNRELAKELKKAGKPVVLVLVNGRPLELNRLEPVSDAILEIWQPGVNGALPMAGILSGRINPSGKLAMTFPYSTGQIPIYYNRRKSGRGHQGFYKDITSDPLYPFGHGLSYTEFKYGTVTPSATKVKRGEKLSAEVTVTNIGARDGAETVHWFISDPYCSITRPVKELKHFEKQLIKAGETKTFRFDIDLERDFGFVNEDGKRFLETGEYNIHVLEQTVKIELID